MLLFLRNSFFLGTYGAGIAYTSSVTILICILKEELSGILLYGFTWNQRDILRRPDGAC